MNKKKWLGLLSMLLGVVISVFTYLSQNTDVCSDTEICGDVVIYAGKADKIVSKLGGDGEHYVEVTKEKTRTKIGHEIVEHIKNPKEGILGVIEVIDMVKGMDDINKLIKEKPNEQK